MSAPAVDVLAAEREQAEAMAALLQGKRSAADWTRAAVANAKAIEARAAVAELIEDMRRIEARLSAANTTAVELRAMRGECQDIARAALARVQGAK